ncbi:glycine zipper domain-containing protein [uncultured Maritimibacter sp.]|jgi:outer membrane lipoprotein SlyB|uniref:glycine zipper domain-containing protein n=1 Tax=uncultured Maritimibacter sp. TaxID=991866 RepID=UPI002613F825|nr:glycine zipper domain-containing protein [uncultured Maritimibacter sp.]
MKTPLIALAVASAFAVAGCESQNQTQATLAGAATGAAIGGLTSGSVGGALIGGATGAVAGNLIGRVADSQTQCYYRDASGQRYVAQCP